MGFFVVSCRVFFDVTCALRSCGMEALEEPASVVVSLGLSSWIMGS